jgi:hypothetical protein
MAEKATSAVQHARQIYCEMGWMRELRMLVRGL